MGHRLVLAKTIAGDGNIAASRESRAIAGVSAGKGNGVVGGLGMIIGCGGDHLWMAAETVIFDES
jgi:hypothetical protein